MPPVLAKEALFETWVRNGKTERMGRIYRIKKNETKRFGPTQNSSLSKGG
jgi:hypothetical protein